jgi:hypothetical protein
MRAAGRLLVDRATLITASTELALTLRRARRHGGTYMSNQVPRFFTQARACCLLGMTEAEFDRISKESGVGHVESAGNEKETYFTYEELQRICELAGRPIETVH